MMYLGVRRECGRGWHFHLRGAGLPSPTDIRAWAACRRELQAVLYAGVIVAPDRWRGRRLRAWILDGCEVREARISEQEVL